MSELPITIVSGLPRSGTSVMMQMIHAGGLPALTDDLRKPDVDNPRGYFEFEPVKQLARDQSWLKNAAGKVVKMVHLLLLDLPLDQEFHYRVVLMVRAPAEVLASQQKMLQRLGSKGAAMDPARLAAIYAQQMARVEQRLAANSSHFTILKISYNDLMSQPAAGAASVNAFLGGSLNEPAMAAAIDPSLYRNRSS